MWLVSHLAQTNVRRSNGRLAECEIKLSEYNFWLYEQAIKRR